MSVRDHKYPEGVELKSLRRRAPKTTKGFSAGWFTCRLIATIIIWGIWIAFTLLFAYRGWVEEKNPFICFVTFPHLFLLVIPAMFMWTKED